MKGLSIGSLFLTDFGVSRVFDGTPMASTLQVGTQNYLAPEVAASNEDPNYDATLADGDPFFFMADSSQVFSFGVLIHELITGEIPARSMKQIVNGELPPLPQKSQRE